MNFIKDAKGTFTVILNNQHYQFDSTHPEHTGLVECLKTGDVEEFLELHNKGYVIEDWAEGNVRFENGVLYYGDEEVHRVIAAGS